MTTVTEQRMKSAERIRELERRCDQLREEVTLLEDFVKDVAKPAGLKKHAAQTLDWHRTDAVALLHDIKRRRLMHG